MVHRNVGFKAASLLGGKLPIGLFALTLFILALPGIARAAAPTQCEASDQGMRPDSDDNIAALNRALSACAGRKIHIAAGVYDLNPKGFATGLVVPTGTTIVGDGHEGPDQTVLRVTNGGTFAAVFWIRNASNVSIRGLRFEGSSYESGCTRHLDYGHAIYVYSDQAQRAGVESLTITDNAFHDFNGQSWITINAQPGSPGIGQASQIDISNNVFESDADLQGGCSGTGGIGYPTAMVWLHGSDVSAQGLVSNVSVASNAFNAGFVKSAVAIWSGTRLISVQYNVVRDAGLWLPAAPGTELGRYAVLIYNSAHDSVRELAGLHPDSISVIGNEITNPVSCGIYVARGRNLDISSNRISGQRDRFDGTLPKGAIALNHADSVLSLKDNELSDNYIAISSVGSQLNLGANRITVPSGGSATKIVRD
jgi:hypothetical protein